MTRDTDTDTDTPDTRAAKAKAREAIGKLIGDDAEVRTGRAEQDAAEHAAPERRSGE